MFDENYKKQLEQKKLVKQNQYIVNNINLLNSFLDEIRTIDEMIAKIGQMEEEGKKEVKKPQK